MVPSFFTEDDFPFVISLTTEKRGSVFGITVGPPITHLTAEVRMPEASQTRGRA